MKLRPSSRVRPWVPLRLFLPCLSARKLICNLVSLMGGLKLAVHCLVHTCDQSVGLESSLFGKSSVLTAQARIFRQSAFSAAVKPFPRSHQILYEVHRSYEDVSNNYWLWKLILKRFTQTELLLPVILALTLELSKINYRDNKKSHW